MSNNNTGKESKRLKMANEGVLNEQYTFREKNILTIINSQRGRMHVKQSGSVYQLLTMHLLPLMAVSFLMGLLYTQTFQLIITGCVH